MNVLIIIYGTIPLLQDLEVVSIFGSYKNTLMTVFIPHTPVWISVLSIRVKWLDKRAYCSTVLCICASFYFNKKHTFVSILLHLFQHWVLYLKIIVNIKGEKQNFIALLCIYLIAYETECFSFVYCPFVFLSVILFLCSLRVYDAFNFVIAIYELKAP